MLLLSRPSATTKDSCSQSSNSRDQMLQPKGDKLPLFVTFLEEDNIDGVTRQREGRCRSILCRPSPFVCRRKLHPPLLMVSTSQMKEEHQSNTHRRLSNVAVTDVEGATHQRERRCRAILCCHPSPFFEGHTFLSPMLTVAPTKGRIDFSGQERYYYKVY